MAAIRIGFKIFRTNSKSTCKSRAEDEHRVLETRISKTVLNYSNSGTQGKAIFPCEGSKDIIHDGEKCQSQNIKHSTKPNVKTSKCSTSKDKSNAFERRDWKLKKQVWRDMYHLFHMPLPTPELIQQSIRELKPRPKLASELTKRRQLSKNANKNKEVVSVERARKKCKKILSRAHTESAAFTTYLSFNKSKAMKFLNLVKSNQYIHGRFCKTKILDTSYQQRKHFSNERLAYLNYRCKRREDPKQECCLNPTYNPQRHLSTVNSTNENSGSSVDVEQRFNKTSGKLWEPTSESLIFLEPRKIPINKKSSICHVPKISRNQYRLLSTNSFNKKKNSPYDSIYKSSKRSPKRSYPIKKELTATQQIIYKKLKAKAFQLQKVSQKVQFASNPDAPACDLELLGEWCMMTNKQKAVFNSLFQYRQKQPMMGDPARYLAELRSLRNTFSPKFYYKYKVNLKDKEDSIENLCTLASLRNPYSPQTVPVKLLYDFSNLVTMPPYKKSEESISNDNIRNEYMLTVDSKSNKNELQLNIKDSSAIEEPANIEKDKRPKGLRHNLMGFDQNKVQRNNAKKALKTYAKMLRDQPMTSKHTFDKLDFELFSVKPKLKNNRQKPTEETYGLNHDPNCAESNLISSVSDTVYKCKSSHSINQPNNSVMTTVTNVRCQPKSESTSGKVDMKELHSLMKASRLKLTGLDSLVEACTIKPKYNCERTTNVKMFSFSTMLSHRLNINNSSNTSRDNDFHDADDLNRGINKESKEAPVCKDIMKKVKSADQVLIAKLSKRGHTVPKMNWSSTNLISEHESLYKNIENTKLRMNALNVMKCEQDKNDSAIYDQAPSNSTPEPQKSIKIENINPEINASDMSCRDCVPSPLKKYSTIYGEKCNLVKDQDTPDKVNKDSNPRVTKTDKLSVELNSFESFTRSLNDLKCDIQNNNSSTSSVDYNEPYKTIQNTSADMNTSMVSNREQDISYPSSDIHNLLGLMKEHDDSQKSNINIKSKSYGINIPSNEKERLNLSKPLTQDKTHKEIEKSRSQMSILNYRFEYEDEKPSAEKTASMFSNQEQDTSNSGSNKQEHNLLSLIKEYNLQKANFLNPFIEDEKTYRSVEMSKPQTTVSKFPDLGQDSSDPKNDGQNLNSLEVSPEHGYQQNVVENAKPQLNVLDVSSCGQDNKLKHDSTIPVSVHENRDNVIENTNPLMNVSNDLSGERNLDTHNGAKTLKLRTNDLSWGHKISDTTSNKPELHLYSCITEVKNQHKQNLMEYPQLNASDDLGCEQTLSSNLQSWESSSPITEYENENLKLQEDSLNNLSSNDPDNKQELWNNQVNLNDSNEKKNVVDLPQNTKYPNAVLQLTRVWESLENGILSKPQAKPSLGNTVELDRHVNHLQNTSLLQDYEKTSTGYPIRSVNNRQFFNSEPQEKLKSNFKKTDEPVKYTISVSHDDLGNSKENKPVNPTLHITPVKKDITSKLNSMIKGNHQKEILAVEKVLSFNALMFQSLKHNIILEKFDRKEKSPQIGEDNQNTNDSFYINAYKSIDPLKVKPKLKSVQNYQFSPSEYQCVNGNFESSSSASGTIGSLNADKSKTFGSTETSACYMTSRGLKTCKSDKTYQIPKTIYSSKIQTYFSSALKPKQSMTPKSQVEEISDPVDVDLSVDSFTSTPHRTWANSEPKLSGTNTNIKKSILFSKFDSNDQSYTEKNELNEDNKNDLEQYSKIVTDHNKSVSKEIEYSKLKDIELIASTVIETQNEMDKMNENNIKWKDLEAVETAAEESLLVGASINLHDIVVNLSKQNCTKEVEFPPKALCTKSETEQKKNESKTTHALKFGQKKTQFSQMMSNVNAFRNYSKDCITKKPNLNSKDYKDSVSILKTSPVSIDSKLMSSKVKGNDSVPLNTKRFDSYAKKMHDIQEGKSVVNDHLVGLTALKDSCKVSSSEKDDLFEYLSKDRDNFAK